MQILIVEDDVRLARALAHILEENGYGTDVVHDGATGLAWAEVGRYDVIVLDVMLPKKDGFSVVADLRRTGVSTPVLLLTARDAIADRVAGLDSGANDYLVKPFALEELSARLRVLTRSQFGAGDSRLVAGDLTLDTGTRRVKRGGAEIALSAREYALLEYLMHNKDIVLSREKIENHVWNFDYEGGTNVVDVYIRYLRKKIDDGHERKLIHTVRGMGYVLREETP